ncbi:MAG: hypothetical protein IJ087_18755, partial [Eggerthellaceae bacterium]|nr:hypothetical protein [Eggerthellaceae bacterium]
QSIGADGHAWNRARIGSSWFNIDVTWDDNYTDPDPTATPDTTYFLKSDAWFKAHPGSSGFHTSWAPAGVAGTDTCYDQYEQQDWPVYSASAASPWLVDLPAATGLAKGKTQVISGTTYKVTSNSAKNPTVTVKKAPANKKSVTVPATVAINGKQYAVTGIAGSAFAKSAATTVTVKTKSLTKATVTNCFKNSKVATVKAPKAKLSAYKTIFAKSNSGKKVAIK